MATDFHHFQGTTYVNHKSMSKYIVVALVSAVTAIGTSMVVAAPAQAYTESSTAPTTAVSNVARGGTIKVRVNNHGSKVLKRVSTLWKDGKRVYDWSPKPGAYKVKSIIKYQKRITTETENWVPWSDCAEYSYEGFDACAEGNYGDWETVTTTRLGSKQSVTRWNGVRVHSDETPGCVSLSEFRAVKDGMTQSRVHGIFGTRGHVEYEGSGGVGREYRTCTGDPDWSYVSVDYNPRVWFKWRYISY